LLKLLRFRCGDRCLGRRRKPKKLQRFATSAVRCTAIDADIGPPVPVCPLSLQTGVLPHLITLTRDPHCIFGARNYFRIIRPTGRPPIPRHPAARRNKPKLRQLLEPQARTLLGVLFCGRLGICAERSSDVPRSGQSFTRSPSRLAARESFDKVSPELAISWIASRMRSTSPLRAATQASTAVSPARPLATIAAASRRPRRQVARPAVVLVMEIRPGAASWPFA